MLICGNDVIVIEDRERELRESAPDSEEWRAARAALDELEALAKRLEPRYRKLESLQMDLFEMKNRQAEVERELAKLR